MDQPISAADAKGLPETFCLAQRSRLRDLDAELRRPGAPWQVARKVHNKAQSTNSYTMDPCALHSSYGPSPGSTSPSGGGFSSLLPNLPFGPSSSAASLSPSSSASSINASSGNLSMDVLVSPPSSPLSTRSSYSSYSSASVSGSGSQPMFVRVDSEIRASPSELYKYYIVDTAHTFSEFSASTLTRGTLYRSVYVDNAEVQYVLTRSAATFIPTREDVALTFYGGGNARDDGGGGALGKGEYYYRVATGLGRQAVGSLENSAYLPMAIRRKKLIRGRLVFASDRIAESGVHSGYSVLSSIVQYDPTVTNGRAAISARSAAKQVVQTVMQEHAKVAAKFGQRSIRRITSDHTRA